jgi:hypothetical protein
VRPAGLHGGSTPRTRHRKSFPAHRTECERCVCSGTTLRAILQKRLTKNEVQNDTDGVGYEDRKQNPKNRPHSSSTRIPGDIPNDQYVDGKHHRDGQANKGDESDPTRVAVTIIQQPIRHYSDGNEQNCKDSQYACHPWNDFHFFAQSAHNALPISPRLRTSSAVDAAVIEATANEARNQGPALTRFVPNTSIMPPDSSRTSNQKETLETQEKIPSPHSVTPFQRKAAASSRSRSNLA